VAIYLQDINIVSQTKNQRTFSKTEPFVRTYHDIKSRTKKNSSSSSICSCPYTCRYLNSYSLHPTSVFIA